MALKDKLELQAHRVLRVSKEFKAQLD